MSGREERSALRSALAAAMLLASLLGAGCLEKTPPSSKGYLPDSGGIFGEGDCPDAGAALADAGGDVDANDSGDANDSADVDANDSADATDDGGASDADAGTPGAVVEAAGWAGTWTFVSGGSGVGCPDGISDATSTGTLTIAVSASGNGLTVSEDACTFHFTLVGDTATSDCGQSCSAWAIPVIPIWTLTLKPNGTLEEHLGGRISVRDETCTISGTSKLTRP